MPAFLQGILVIIQNLPQIMTFLNKVAEAAENGIDQIQVSIQLKKMDEAIQVAKEKKDTSAIEDIFRK